MGALALLTGSAWAQAPYTTDANTLLLYHFNEGSGATTAVDSSGYSRDATYGSSVTTGLPAQTGMGNAAQTTNSLNNGRITYTDTANPNGKNSFLYSLSSSSFTLEAWVKPNASFFSDFTSGNSPIIAIQPDGYSADIDLQFSILASGGNYYFALGDMAGPNRVWTYTAPLNWVADTWYHVAVTGYETVTPGEWNYTFYNNVAGDSTTPSAWGGTVWGNTIMSPVSGTTNMRGVEVGNYYGNGGESYFRGEIDEVRLSNMARTEFQTIPEPSVVFLLGLGLLLLVFHARHRRRSA